METIPLRGHHIAFFSAYRAEVLRTELSEDLRNEYGQAMRDHIFNLFDTILEGASAVKVTRGFDRVCRPRLSEHCQNCITYAGMVPAAGNPLPAHVFANARDKPAHHIYYLWRIDMEDELDALLFDWTIDETIPPAQFLEQTKWVSGLTHHLTEGKTRNPRDLTEYLTLDQMTASFPRAAQMMASTAWQDVRRFRQEPGPNNWKDPILREPTDEEIEGIIVRHGLRERYADLTEYYRTK